MTLIRERALRLDWRPFAIIAASVACVSSTALVVDGYKTTHKPIRSALEAPRTISAFGTASRHVDPDQVRWVLTVSTHAADERAARRNAMAVAEKARAFLVAHDVRANEITLLPVEVEGATRTVVHHTADGSEEQDDIPNGFDGTQKLRVSSTDVARIVAAFRSATSSSELDSVEVEEPACSFSRIMSLEPQLLVQARLAVRQRAEATIKGVGGAHLGRLVAVDAGSFGAQGFTEASIATCEHGADATVNVSATFELK
jgi:hypothetical protein